MSYHPRIECSEIACLQTTRTRNSELWFVNNDELEDAILGYAARYSTRYEVIMYALAIEGNHTHQINHFPNANRAHYMRDFNSSVARAIPRFQTNYPGGRPWARRYSSDFLPSAADIEEYFFYVVLQPVKDGLVNDIRQYPGYNCFEDAVTGRVRQYCVVNWKKYNDAKRWDPNVPIEKFLETHSLKFSRLPGYEGLSQAEYESMMRRKLKKRTADIIRQRAGKPCLGADKLTMVQPGSRPHRTKTSSRYDHRPRVLSRNPKRRATGNDWYFQTIGEYKHCSKLYRAGDLTVVFPKGTYKPPLFTVAFSGAIC